LFGAGVVYFVTTVFTGSVIIYFLFKKVAMNNASDILRMDGGKDPCGKKVRVVRHGDLEGHVFSQSEYRASCSPL
jgi:hypothetical protein